MKKRRSARKGTDPADTSDKAVSRPRRIFPKNTFFFLSNTGRHASVGDVSARRISCGFESRLDVSKFSNHFSVAFVFFSFLINPPRAHFRNASPNANECRS